RALPPERRLRERLRADRDARHAHQPRPRGPSDPGAAGGDRDAAEAAHLDRAPAARRRGADRGRRRDGPPARRGGRDLRAHTARDEGLRGRRVAPGARRLAADARHGLGRRGRLPLHRRAQGRHDHPRRREHRARGGRGDAAVPSRRRGGGSDGRARPRGGSGRGRSRARRPPSRHPRPAAVPAVELVVRDGVAWMTLGRPASGNRLDAELLGALVEASAAAEDDDGVRVLVLAAQGPAFSLGLPRACRWPERSWPDGVGALGGLTKPVIAAIQGAAVGWGLALALACDLRIASTAAVLAVPEIGERRFPGGGVTQRLPRMIGTARAMELVLLGTRLPAAPAAAWGLASAAVTPAR